MLRSIYLILIFLCAGAQARTIKVIMKSISYDPKVVEAKVGDEIEWKNESYTQHSATADQGASFNTGMIDPKKTSSKIELKTPGEIRYHCSLHGKTMSGTITVKP